MNKRSIILGLLIIIAVPLSILGFKLKTVETNGNILNKYGISNNYKPENGIVPDEESAIKIANTVLVSIYGDSVNNNMPFDVKFDKDYNSWVVNGTLKENEIGGVPNVIIKKSDGEIIAVWHTK